MDIDIPNPSIEQVEIYLTKWDGLENYHLQEDALNKLFFERMPKEYRRYRYSIKGINA